MVAHQQRGLQSGPREEHHHHRRKARRRQNQNTAGAADTRDARRDDGSAGRPQDGATGSRTGTA